MPGGKIEKGYSKSQVALRVGLPARTVRFFTDRGLVEPEISNPGRRGRAAIYSKRNLLEFAVLREITAWGVPVELAGHVLARMRFKNIFDEPEQAVTQGEFIAVCWADISYESKRHSESLTIMPLRANELFKLAKKYERGYKTGNCILVLDLKEIFKDLLKG